MALNLTSKSKITWCPGCPNGQILVSYRQALTELVGDGAVKLENVVAVAGVGCHGKISDYLQMNTFTSLHGRLVPSMTGIKMGNPELTVTGFTGDGDSLSEGIAHLLHAAKRNTDVALFMHDNQLFALTTGQVTATSPRGHKGRSTPFGSIEDPVNAAELVLAAGATFVARSYALDIARTKAIMKEAMLHKGFAFVDIIQPCLTFFDTRDFYTANTYWIDEKKFPTSDKKAAMEKITEAGPKVALGVFYKKEKPTFEGELHAAS
jgi:2-oxoglutarate ferredoxin oxidoreductase subunit beta